MSSRSSYDVSIATQTPHSAANGKQVSACLTRGQYALCANLRTFQTASANTLVTKKSNEEGSNVPRHKRKSKSKSRIHVGMCPTHAMSSR